MFWMNPATVRKGEEKRLFAGGNSRARFSAATTASTSAFVRGLNSPNARSSFCKSAPGASPRSTDVWSGCTATAARRRAIDAPYAKPPIELATTQRWGTAWCWPDKSREADLPIDDSDMGCDCGEKCEIVPPWTRQIAAIEIEDSRDAITDNGQELCNLFAERGIENVLICGVHLNMCVLGRPCAIRQLVKLGKNVVLVRDMTDTMYNHLMPPRVDHFTGTDRVVEHVEKYWCPTIASPDLVGGQPFRFAADRRAR